MVTFYLFVLCLNKQTKNVNGDINYKFVFLYIIGTNQTAYMMQLIAWTVLMVV